jgi:hypothetical protein
MEAEHQGALYFKKSKIIFISSKNSENKLAVVNKIFYKSAKSQCKILCVLGYTNMKNSDKNYSFEMCIIHYTQIHTFVNFV